MWGLDVRFGEKVTLVQTDVSTNEAAIIAALHSIFLLNGQHGAARCAVFMQVSVLKC